MKYIPLSTTTMEAFSINDSPVLHVLKESWTLMLYARYESVCFSKKEEEQLLSLMKSWAWGGNVR